MCQLVRLLAFIVSLTWPLSVLQAQRDSLQTSNFSFTALHVGIGDAEKLFGLGGMHIRTSGVAETVMGIKRVKNENPFLSEQNRNRTFFHFDEKVQLTTYATIGDKVNFELNYTTESRFDVDSKRLKLTYKGYEDEILQVLEAGKIRAYTSNAFIQPGEDLFGVQAQLRFGRLQLSTFLSEQKRSPVFRNDKNGQSVTFELTANQYDENRHFFLSNYFRDNYNNALRELPTVAAAGYIQQVEVWVTNTQQDYNQIRSVVATAAAGGISEEVPNARRLDESEYTLNRSLGYISLTRALATDEVLAAAYVYSSNGTLIQQGEFAAAHLADTTVPLRVQLLKKANQTPDSPTWGLMMKNIYTLPPGNFTAETFRLDILYRNEAAGTPLAYLPESSLKGVPLLRILNLDRLTKQGEPSPDGYFDFVNGYTIQPEKGLLIFPVTEPFGSFLREKAGNETAISPYIFQEVYDSTRTVADSYTEKNKFILRGRYALAENDSTPPGAFAEARRSMVMGLDLNFRVNEHLTVGATVARSSERPSYSNEIPGEEPINNMMWGAQLGYRNKLSVLKKPAHLFFSTDFAQLIPVQPATKKTGRYTYLDDFESARRRVDLLNPAYWSLSATPFDDAATPLFPEATLRNDVNYGKNRALLAWYCIDRIFTRWGTGLMPPHLRNDRAQLASPYVRAVHVNELFPEKAVPYAAEAVLPVLNLAFYPEERGPYNLDAEHVHPDGTLALPEKRWGGIMRTIEQPDFEAANINYLECWILDPFIQDKELGGDLYFNLGELSEDVLKDGKLFVESELPMPGDGTQPDTTVWGKVPARTGMPRAFENTPARRRQQDTGLNGLSSEEELNYPAYRDYLSCLTRKLTPETIARMQADPFSPMNNPATDTYHHYRGTDYDRLQTPILTRYKYYNGTEGNSAGAEDSPEKYSTAARVLPDTEDGTGDNTLSDEENYYQYKISIRPGDLVPGTNYITDKRTATVLLENGTEEQQDWYQFKIPLSQYEKRIGNPRDFRHIRFIRLFMTGFRRETVLRFATLELTGGEWRSDARDEMLKSSTVSLEENAGRIPVSYVSPPDVSRVTDRSEPHPMAENEQSLSLKVTELPAAEERAVYKNTLHDLRLYKRLQLFVHAEALGGGEIRDGDLSVFLRLGSDSRNNYYEYEVPLAITPPGRYNGESRVSREAVWPRVNSIDLPLDVFTKLKLSRNELMHTETTDVRMDTLFSVPHAEQPLNRVGIKGNPALSDINVLMIGVRNRSTESKSGEIWVDELRLGELNEAGGWAMNSTLNAAVADIASLQWRGGVETNGFGGLNQSAGERRSGNLYHYTLDAALDVGKLLPQKMNVSLPFSVHSGQEINTLRYNPLDQDILLTDALDRAETASAQDSLRLLAQRVTQTKIFSLDNARIAVRSKCSMPYDPANFSFGYTFYSRNYSSPETVYERNTDFKGYLTYSYQPPHLPILPFGDALPGVEINYLPASVSFQTSLNRTSTETQLRNLIHTAPDEAIPVSEAQTFCWNREFSLQWNLTSQLFLSVTSGTKARIEEAQRFAKLGTPYNYGQEVTSTYQVPFQFVPFLNWIHASCQYTAEYSWQKEVFAEADIPATNTIRNRREVDIRCRLSLETLYRKWQPGRKKGARRPFRWWWLLRNIQLSHVRTDGLMVSGFCPEIGDVFGQTNLSGRMAPGVGFAFGLETGAAFLRKAEQNGWLRLGENTIRPARLTETRNFTVRVLLEPLPGLKAEVSAYRTESTGAEIHGGQADIPAVRRTSIRMSALPAAHRLRPNWKINYSRAIKQGRISHIISNLQLTHQYACAYETDLFSYSALPVSRVTERFCPLLGTVLSFPNDLTIRMQYNRTKSQSTSRTTAQSMEAFSNEIVFGAGYKVDAFNRKIRRRRQIAHELKLNADYGRRALQSVIRKSADNQFYITDGLIARTIRLSADYGVNSFLSLRLFYDFQMNKPLLTVGSFYSSESNFGLSLFLALKP